MSLDMLGIGSIIEGVALTGKVPMPDGSTEKQLDGHAVLATRSNTRSHSFASSPASGRGLRRGKGRAWHLLQDVAYALPVG